MRWIHSDCLRTWYSDLIAKVDYYLSHDDERRRIACNGYEKVKSECTFEKRMNKILSGML